MLAVPSWTFYQLPTDLTHGCAVSSRSLAFQCRCWTTARRSIAVPPRCGGFEPHRKGGVHGVVRGEHFQKNGMTPEKSGWGVFSWWLTLCEDDWCWSCGCVFTVFQVTFESHLIEDHFRSQDLEITVGRLQSVFWCQFDWICHLSSSHLDFQTLTICTLW